MQVVSDLLGDLLRGLFNILVIPEKDFYWNEIEKAKLNAGVSLFVRMQRKGENIIITRW